MDGWGRAGGGGGETTSDESSLSLSERANGVSVDWMDEWRGGPWDGCIMDQDDG